MCIRDRYQRRVHGEIIRMAKQDEDKVVASYDIVMNPSTSHDFYLLQYLLRPAGRGYGDQGKLSKVHMRPMQGQIRMEYALDTTSANYDKSAADNRITTQVLDGTPVPLNTHYCIGKLEKHGLFLTCLLYTSPSPRDLSTSRMPSSA
eukprot:TRINITY_DN9709_c0_g1_i2.p1 TRINITY_DN9709_c0_g1~~TRINITY_DN9709_c0_g1_i2.p1  ORF type:complete len:147 (+),score=33.50 TRINITY_DN9709_c0_g1_i2:150-590(+)